MRVSLKSCSSDCDSLESHEVLSPISFQARYFGGLSFRCRSQKSEVPVVEFKPFALQVEVPGFELPQDCGSLCWVWG